MVTHLSCPLLFLVLAVLATAGCGRPAPARGGEARPGVAAAVLLDPVGDRCRARAEALLAAPDLGGSPAFERNRIEILGRARGEPLVLVREPAPASDAALAAIGGPALVMSRRAFEAGRPGSRVGQLRARHRGHPQALRAVMLREGYLFSTVPRDALAMVTRVELTDLFDEPEIWLYRGGERHRLRRVQERRRGRADVSYRYARGVLEGRRASLLFGDRVGVTEQDIDAPLHRDLRALAEAIGFDRARVLRRTRSALLADLRFGDDSLWARAVLETPTPQAALRLGCLAADRATRARISAARDTMEPRLQALARVRATVTEEVDEALRFDRPQGETGPDRDGELRPVWADAYRRGRAQFEIDGVRYAVFDAEGRPWPPQVCVDFVLDTFERASGTWFAPKGSATLGRVRGALDFDDQGIENRRAVIAFGEYAEAHPSLFDFRRFHGDERVPFGERSRFFRFLADHSEAVRPGDVVAIRGRKADGRIHQHAILVEWSDPVTGFPAGLADQMKRPRRRTWEGIMAEAPKRSLYYRARPVPSLLAEIVRGGS